METCNKEDTIQKKADKMFFDRDRIKWVSWDSGIESVKTVAGRGGAEPHAHQEEGDGPGREDRGEDSLSDDQVAGVLHRGLI